jgi:hypothetical protein
LGIRYADMAYPSQSFSLESSLGRLPEYSGHEGFGYAFFMFGKPIENSIYKFIKSTNNMRNSIRNVI